MEDILHIFLGFRPQGLGFRVYAPIVAIKYSSWGKLNSALVFLS